MSRKTRELIKKIYPYIIVVIVVVLIRSFIVTPAVVDGQSMEDTLYNYNVVILNKLDYKLNDIKRFDVVVLKYNGEKLIKRVIGLPGEHVEYKDGNLYIDGFLTEDTYGKTGTDDFKLETLGYLNIPGDMYFVVGDNRNNSADSRILGLIKKEDILGSESYRIFPLTKIGRVK